MASTNPAVAEAIARAKEVAKRLTSKRTVDDGGGDAGGDYHGDRPERTSRFDRDDRDYHDRSKRPHLSSGSDHRRSSSRSPSRDSRGAEQGGMAHIPQNRPLPSYKVSEEWSIPESHIGAVIGQVTKIERQIGCRVQIPSAPTGKVDRSVTLYGTRNEINRCKEIIENILRAAREDDSGANSTDMEVVVENMSIPPSRVSQLIGRGGENIKDLQLKCSVKMVIVQGTDTPENEPRPLRITGLKPNVEKAVRQVYALLNENDAGRDGRSGGGSGGGRGMPLGSTPQDYTSKLMSGDTPNSGGSRGTFGTPGGGGGSTGPPRIGLGAIVPTPGSALALALKTQVEKMPVPKSAVGLVIGKGGETIRAIALESNARVVFADNDDGQTERMLTLQGKPESITEARRIVNSLIESSQQTRTPRAYMGGGGGGGGGEGNDDRHEDFVSVPASRTGLIIGRGGETIKGFSQTSGARIELDKNPNSNELEKIFRLRGTRQQVEKAREMILEKANEQPPQHAGGGRGGMDDRGGDRGGRGGRGGFGRGRGGGGDRGGWQPHGGGGGGQYPSSYNNGNGSGGYGAQGGLQMGAQQDPNAAWMAYYNYYGMYPGQYADPTQQQQQPAAPGVGEQKPMQSQPPPPPGMDSNPASARQQTQRNEAVAPTEQQQQQGGEATSFENYTEENITSWIQYYRQSGWNEHADQLEQQWSKFQQEKRAGGGDAGRQQQQGQGESASHNTKGEGNYNDMQGGSSYNGGGHASAQQGGAGDPTSDSYWSSYMQQSNPGPPPPPN